jgi:hypothetical protein
MHTAAGQSAASAHQPFLPLAPQVIGAHLTCMDDLRAARLVCRSWRQHVALDRRCARVTLGPCPPSQFAWRLQLITSCSPRLEQVHVVATKQHAMVTRCLPALVQVRGAKGVAGSIAGRGPAPSVLGLSQQEDHARSRRAPLVLDGLGFLS